MKSKKIILFILIFAGLLSIFIIKQKKVQSLGTTVKSTMSTSQLSFFARLDGEHISSSTNVKIKTDGSTPSNTSNNLFIGDTVSIANSVEGSDKFVIGSIGNTSSFNITTGLGDSNIVADSYIIATRSSTHIVEFGNVAVVSGDRITYLIQATDLSGENSSDGIPDMKGFDVKAVDVTCPVGTTWEPGDIGTTQVALIGSNNYSFRQLVCISNVAGSVGSSMVVSGLINPTRLSGSEGTANIINFFVKHTNSTGGVIDSRQGQVASVESVRVSASVDPTFTFTIGTSGTVGVGDTICGAPLSSGAADTTAASVTFGSVALGAFNNLAQHLSCVTNASGGYIITVYENDTLSSPGSTIPDTTCESGTCAWNDADGSPWTEAVDHYGFGYSVQNIGASLVSPSYGSNPGDFAAVPFGHGSSQARTIMSNNDRLTQVETAFVCYRLNVSPLQTAGTYQNQLTYTATATF